MVDAATTNTTNNNIYFYCTYLDMRVFFAAVVEKNSWIFVLDA